MDKAVLYLTFGDVTDMMITGRRNNSLRRYSGIGIKEVPVLWIKRKKSKLLEEPILPVLCKMIFLGMLILTAAMLLVDLNAFVRYDSHLGNFVCYLSFSIKRTH